MYQQYNEFIQYRLFTGLARMNGSDLNRRVAQTEQSSSSTMLFGKKKNEFHMTSNNDEIAHPCDQCEYVATRKDTLMKHKKSNHEGVRYPCDQCDHVATQQSSLYTHKKSKHEGVRYPCDQCDYVATQQSSLNAHKQSKHEGVRYPCDQCDYVATLQSNMITHKNSKHKGIRYPCEHCDHVATHKSHLKTHKQSKHEGARFPCVQCDYVTAHKSSLNTHKKFKHEEVRYQCNQCDYFATKQSILNTHKNSNHKEIRYPCNRCEYVATLSSSLYRHKRIKHKIGIFDESMIVKEKDVEVMIEKLDLSKYLKLQNIQNLTEPEFIKVSGLDVADTEIKTEAGVDPLATNDLDSDGMVKDETQDGYEECITSNTSSVELKQEEDIDDPLSLIKIEPVNITEGDFIENIHKNNPATEDVSATVKQEDDMCDPQSVRQSG